MAMAPVDDSYPEDKKLRLHPSQSLLADLDAAYGWITWLHVRGRKILWLRAEGHSWGYIGHQVGLRRLWAQKMWRKHVHDIIARDEISSCGQLREATGT